MTADRNERHPTPMRARVHRLILCLGFVLTLLPSRTLAQTFNFDPFNPIIGGAQVNCVDISGQAVRLLLDPFLGDIGRAVPGFPPTILLNSTLLVQLPPKLQLFWYGHECAHHVLGHAFLFNVANESAADCWSIQTGKRQGLFDRDDVVGFAPYFANNPGTPWGHLPGPQRSALLVDCFDGKVSLGDGGGGGGGLGVLSLSGLCALFLRRFKKVRLSVHCP